MEDEKKPCNWTKELMPVTSSAGRSKTGTLKGCLPDNESVSIRQFSYFEADSFRPGVRSLSNHVTPLTLTIDAGQSALRLPGCDVYRLRTFSRIVDGQAALGCTVVAFTIEDRHPVTINGWTKDRPSLAIGHDDARYKAVEAGPGDFGMIVFHPAVDDRGWPQTTTTFAIVPIAAEAEQALRELLLGAFSVASESPDDFVKSAAGLKERFLSSIDEAIASSEPEASIRANSEKYFHLVEGVDVYFSKSVDQPVYSDKLAASLGVSVRTLANAVAEYRGMSLHRYLRLKRLWLVRKALLDGETSIKASALMARLGHVENWRL